jgi:hypothetical protein
MRLSVQVRAATAALSLIPTFAFAEDTVASFRLASGHKVSIVEAPFADSKLKYSESAPCLVDGHIPFGTDCSVPTTYVKSISVEVRRKALKLDASHMFNAWGTRHLTTYEGKPVTYFVGSCPSKDLCYFRGIFSDGAGTFVAEWKVFQGVTVRTVISSEEEFISLFMKSMDAK